MFLCSRNWFLERVLKLGLTNIAKEYQCVRQFPISRAMPLSPLIDSVQHVLIPAIVPGSWRRNGNKPITQCSVSVCVQLNPKTTSGSPTRTMSTEHGISVLAYLGGC